MSDDLFDDCEPETQSIRRVEGTFICTACGVGKSSREKMVRHLTDRHMKFAPKEDSDE